ncbi:MULTISPECIES: capsule biosynthesis protein [Methylobacterium]|jgi:capsular polysaccharide transport system permease protein|uniref:capsule biosynthesis protein n=1 Tax=Methylobacterium TaxID=407 RepID=UPI0008EC576D|nr:MULTISPECIES: capsule biosynthesis protein [Methylobacterium]MBZ6411291.1 capsule biosynthesis protein [Methylobacterium sp.]MBK3395617.1 capsule biosynthesis protein [Methylobacterium ajmalii]MBK3412011.1 capsule biosynthesis protein [Methylobacterium ajmalii]MBK3422446.1 capsule biosynthesis protein [Methylobacterium ajmalii]SFE15303.1 capsular polysaccharide transport system permease protein [Methylobacterium sp. yr596]
MDADEVKRRDRLGSMIAFARRTVPELRRNAETVEPIAPADGRRRLPALLNPLRWTRLPLVPGEGTQNRVLARLLRNIGLFVLLPTAVVGIYLFAFAADQYVVEARFAIRGEVEPMGNVALGEFSSLIQKNNSQDSYIVQEYIQSQPMLESAQKELNVVRMFTRDEADFWTRYSGDKPIEELLKYWRKRVQVHIDLISGVMTLTVRAFTPDDALAIGQHVVARAEALINAISSRAQQDMLKHSKDDLAATEERLRKAHLALREFRNRWGIIDPAKSAEATMTTLLSLRKDKIKSENDLQVLRGSGLDEKSRSIQTIVASLTATNQQIKQLEDTLTSDGVAVGGRPVSEAILEYEGLMVERTIAEKLNDSATMMLDRARVAANRQHVYLAVFVPPTRPELSTVPMRGHALFVAFFAFVVMWGCSSLLIAGVKDHNM